MAKKKTTKTAKKSVFPKEIYAREEYGYPYFQPELEGEDGEKVAVYQLVSVKTLRAAKPTLE